MWLPHALHRLEHRSPAPSTQLHQLFRRSSGKTMGMIVAFVIIGVLLIGTLIAVLLLRYLRGRYDNPKYVPGRKLKAKWIAWTPGPVKRRYSTSLQDRRSITASRNASPHASRPMSRVSHTSQDRTPSRQADRQPETDVNRHTSVRSVITLPAYSQSVRETEQVIAREGERGGVDTVVEFPETIDEEEARREEEMESLYQIRQQRREERTQREERRRQRDAARARGDTVTLEELARQERARGQHGAAGASTASLNPRNEQSLSAAMMAEHQARDRGRRISSVSYADLGVARHDGSRVRAGSNTSDNAPLLSSAASMGSGSAGLVGRDSESTLRRPFRSHTATHSVSSLRRQAGDSSDDARDSSSDFEVVPLSATRERSRDTARSDLGEGSLVPTPSTEPPDYEHVAREPARDIYDEAPPYESPVDVTRPAGPDAFPDVLPEIEVTSFSPVISPPEEIDERTAALR